MRRTLNKVRFNDLLSLEYLKSTRFDSHITVEYPIGTKIPKSFAVSEHAYIELVIIRDTRDLNILLIKDANLLLSHTRFIIKYKLSKHQYIEFKLLVI